MAFEQAQTKPLDIADELKKLRERTTTELSMQYNTFNALILGESGVGKTSLLETARKPVLIHSFDPGGSKLRNFLPLIKDGSVIVDSQFEVEDMKKPSAYMAWENEFEKLKRDNIFSGVGTYVIDSFTTWISSLKNEIAKRKGRSESILQIQDWQVIGNIVVDTMKLCTALPCDFILNGHLTLEKDEVSGRHIARFKTIPSLRIDIPLLFDEIYVMLAEGTRDGVERRLLTQPDGKYLARTRIGARLFDVYEEADISLLLKKAGMVE